MRPRVLVVAGSEPLAYSGLEADVRHLDALLCDAAPVATARTQQGASRVITVEPVDVRELRREIGAAVASGVLAIKIGMLHCGAVVRTVVEALTSAVDLPIVLDPVIWASDGKPLLVDGGLEALCDDLLPHVSLVTPNLPELAAMVPGVPDPVIAARHLLDRGAGSVLVKGGHGDGDVVEDALVQRSKVHRMRSPRVAGPSPRGTGCALATATAAHLARGASMEDAVSSARALVADAIAACRELGTRFLVIDPYTRSDCWSRIRNAP